VDPAFLAPALVALYFALAVPRLRFAAGQPCTTTIALFVSWSGVNLLYHLPGRANHTSTFLTLPLMLDLRYLDDLAVRFGEANSDPRLLMNDASELETFLEVPGTSSSSFRPPLRQPVTIDLRISKFSHLT
jgi:hypothetical protein